jgi:hypothetical protein
VCSSYDKASIGVNLRLLSCVRVSDFCREHKILTVTLTRLISVLCLLNVWTEGAILTERSVHWHKCLLFVQCVDRRGHVIRKVCTLAHQLIILPLKKG